MADLLSVAEANVSHRWLMMNDRHEEAKRVLARIHTPEEAEVEAVQIQQSVEVDRRLESSWWSMVAKKSYRKRTILAVGMALSIHTSGILVVNNVSFPESLNGSQSSTIVWKVRELTAAQYGPTIYGSLGYDTNKQLIFQMGWCFVAITTGFISFFLIDRYARNKLLAFGVGGCALCLTIVYGLIGKFTSPSALEHPNTSALHAVIAMIYLLNCFYQLGLDGVQFAFLGEIFPNQIRAKGMVVGVATICAINILWLQVAPTAFATIGYKFYMVFFIPGYMATAVLWFLYPNTLGMPLEEVAQLFGDQDEIYGGGVVQVSDEKNGFDVKEEEDNAHVEQL